MDSRISHILATLKKQYPDAHIVLRYGNPWELLVAVMLSAQCTDVMVNKVTEKLFAKYKTVADYVNANLSEFEQDIKSTGFYKAKAKNVIATAKIVHENFNDKVPQRMEELLSLPGVARKTANVVLGNAYHIYEGIAVDTHVLRLSQRLRLVDLTTIGGKKEQVAVTKAGKVVEYKKDADPVKIEQALMQLLPKEEWFDITYRLIDHGRVVCNAQRPDCASCPLQHWCPSSRV